MMPPTTREKSRTAPGISPGRVLIVDDEALVCWAVATALREAGFITDTASTALEALVLARVTPHPDAVLLDSRLIDCNLGELLRQLRAIASNCRVLVMTTEGHAIPPAPYDVLIVRKPFDLPGVVRQVAAEVQRAQIG